ncbi:carbohydrate ABC transporter permease [Paenibacillus sp. MBLB4367]|uniref:carbohydrate ABC transporter permease n=1 Tax=Paenibacillus sp. MBLB4367 TaxID=3384767 RepID=UPI0039083543
MSFAIHKTKADRVVDVILYGCMALFCLATLFPLYFVFIMSITPFKEVMRNGGFVIWPGSFTFEAFATIFNSKVVPRALQVSVFITVVGTALNLLVTMFLAYPLSKKSLPGRHIVLLALVFTMLFSGGLIPTYLTVRATGLINTLWALIIPGLVSTFNALIMKTYFESLPAEVEEAAKVDGCGDLRTLFLIVMPLSMPIIATLGLFYGVGHWNAYFGGIMYLTDSSLYPIQVVLRNMIQSPSISQELGVQQTMVQQLPPETVKMATVVVALVPILAVYPFLQKYFVKGMMIGAIKG